MRPQLHFEEQGVKFLPMFCVGLIAAASATPAAADPFERGLWFRPLVQDQRPRPEPQRDADRPAPQRETRAPGEADRGRMSPDERRQLRRDIQDAGKDIYHRDRQAPRREQRR
ncbi:MAG: hypothetical protein A3I01_01055 [Betaproteobacteria bacterium RIFCSPLOWO2_02_FULL_65_24]|nr:MAG: hypothetical protein A3I01_01055 [Betaproteobacteria bacterium RIFCSPLOWO2_02_FULL_65_24]